jgi:phosphoglycolate phosphatase
MDEAIKKLHDDGCQLFVISSNSEENVKRFLKRHDLLKYFSDVQGSAGLLNKSRGIKRLLKKINAKPDRTYYIGDEARDIEAARKAGVHSIAVSWGYNNIKVLAEHKPNVMVFDPAEIPKVIS